MHQPMVLNFIPNLSALSIMLVTVLAMTTCPVRATHKFKETQLSFYFQEFFGAGDPNATDVAFVGIPGKIWSFSQFATIYALDEPITEGIDPNSASIGRVQGLSIVSALDGGNTLDLLSIVFTNKEYNGSTIEIQGNDKQFEQVRELSVVSGTGKFRFVKGYTTFETVFIDLPSSYVVTQCNVTVKHY